MTLSKAAWRAVRPSKLQNLDAAKLMEALRRKPGDKIEDWQDFLETCDDLAFTLRRTPRMLGKNMTEAFGRALTVWYDDIDDLRKAGTQALNELAHAYVDAACSEIGKAVAAEARGVVERVQARMRAEKKRPVVERDRRTHDQLIAELKDHHTTIRLLRRRKMMTELKENRMARDMIRGKHVRMGRFKMTCDPMLKEMQRALSDAQRDYDKLMKEGQKPAKAEQP
jgi:hypothetical protein